ncbi:unnamed protein product [Allacma fusca]|uniref:Uncharacterized protein n=1 Tax=Allacma fusca TaxID=39272 RepID=A0A8J2NTF0_9HEXA|nr:unnamed protein product [Allacma fusca]
MRTFQLCRGEPLGKFWPQEIDMWENEYRNIEIPYRDFVRESDFCQVQTVSFQVLLERVKTWPAYQGFVKSQGEDEAKTLMMDFVEK